MKNRAFSKIWTIVIVAFFIAGGILAWQKFSGPRLEVEKPQLVSFEIIPSCRVDMGWITYPKGAKAVAKGDNLSKVEFWRSPIVNEVMVGTEDILYSESEIVKKDNQWETSLPDLLYAADFYAVGYDSAGEKIGKISLGNVYGSDQSVRYPENCRKYVSVRPYYTIEFISPRKGEEWETGKQYKIEWKIEPLSELSGVDNDVSIWIEDWSPVATGNPVKSFTITEDTPGNSYVWTVPSFLSQGTKYKIGIRTCPSCRGATLAESSDFLVLSLKIHKRLG